MAARFVKPWGESLAYKGPTCDPLGRVRKYPLRTGSAESLAALQREYRFFTPAILYRLAVINDQPLADLMWELGRDVPVYFKKFPWRLFRGLELPDGDADWNHVLWAVRADTDWGPLADFYCSLAVRNHERDETYRVGLQEVEVVDPLALERHGLAGAAPATVVVSAFGVSATRFLAAFRAEGDPLMDPPRLCEWPPEATQQVFSAALLRGDNPHRAVEEYAWQQRRLLQEEEDRRRGRRTPPYA